MRHQNRLKMTLEPALSQLVALCNLTPRLLANPDAEGFKAILTGKNSSAVTQANGLREDDLSVVFHVVSPSGGYPSSALRPRKLRRGGRSSRGDHHGHPSEAQWSTSAKESLVDPLLFLDTQR